MIAVRWDNGLEMYVFPDEIEIDDKARTATPMQTDTWLVCKRSAPPSSRHQRKRSEEPLRPLMAASAELKIPA
jgi:hypothetical protein